MTITAVEIDPLLRSLGEPGALTQRAACRAALTSSAHVSPITRPITTPFAPARDTQHEKV